MRNTRRSLAVVVATLLAMFTLLPATPASASHRPLISVGVDFSYEYDNTCLSVSPFTCTVTTGVLNLPISVYSRPTPAAPITVGWRLEDQTTTAGVDYTGPTSGTATIPATQDYVAINVPVVDDGVAEPTERVVLRVTSVSINADISNGRGDIWDGGRIPRDCVEAATNNYTRSLTCNNRPAGQQWQLLLDCFHPWAGSDYFYGNIVTGNGTSGASCPEWRAVGSYFRVVA